MRIKNYRELAATPERITALLLLEAGLEACDVERAFTESVSLSDHTLHVKDNSYSLALFNRIYVVGAGKAAGAMARVLEKVLGDRITDGVIIDVQPCKLKRIKCIVGSHPLPSAANQRGSRMIQKLVRGAGAGALILCLISGGGSVLMADPHSSLGSARKTVEALLESGATIREVNTIRKHLYGLAGGNLSAMAYPARIVSLIVSDVVGNDPGLIASGPTSYDESTVSDAKRILRKYHVRAAGLEETPKQEHLFSRTNNTMILTNQNAIDAMVAKAQWMKLDSRVLSAQEQGEAREEAFRLLKEGPHGPGVLIAAGETTVTVKGKGKGGRNQELAAAAMTPLAKDKHIAIASMGTDGADHSDVAGAIVDEQSLALAQKKGLDPAKALAANDTYAFFAKLGGHHIKTGPTGTNVADIMVVVRGPLKGVKLR